MENNLSHLLYFFCFKTFFLFFIKKFSFFFLPHVWKVEWLKYVRKKNICVIYGKNLQGIILKFLMNGSEGFFLLFSQKKKNNFWRYILSNSHIRIYRLVYKVVMVTKSPPQILIGCACLLPKINELNFSSYENYLFFF